MSSPDITRERRTLEKRSLVVFLVALTAIFLYMMRPFLVPLFLAAIIVILLHPVYKFLCGKLGNRARLASFLTTFLVLAILIVPSALIATTVINQTYDVINNLDLKLTYADLYKHPYYTDYFLPFVTDFETRFHLKLDVLDWLTRAGKELAKSVYKFSPQVVITTATFIFDFFIMIFGIYFLFLEGPRLVKVFFELSPLRMTHEQRLSQQFQNMIYATVFGYLVTALVQGALAAIGFAISGISAFVVLGTLTFFFSMVPIIGATGVWLPVCIWFFVRGEIGWAIFNLVYGAVLISGIDNIIKPLIIQGRTHIHPLVIFFSLFGGISLFGPLGILFGPVITALFFATIKIYREEFV